MGTIIHVEPLSTPDNGFYLPGSAVWISGQNTSFGYHSLYADDTEMGLRFPNVTIPGGSTIIAASLRFMPLASSDLGGGTGDATIYAEAADNAVQIVDGDDYASRVLGDNPMYWMSVPHWSSGTPYTFEFLETLVQSVIDRPGWASGNALMFYIKSSPGSPALYQAAGFGHITDDHPRLTIEFDPPATSRNIIVTW